MDVTRAQATNILSQGEAESLPMVAFHVAEKIPIKQVVAAWLDRLVDSSSTDATFQLGPRSFFAVYSFGSCAFFNVSAAQQASVVDKLREIAAPVPGEPSSDDFLVSVGSHARETVQFDRAILNELTPHKIEILLLVLAHSATLEYYETLVEDLLDKAEAITSTMKTGRLPSYSRDTISYIGLSLSTRRDLISALYIVDAPEIVWQDRHLDRLFNQMKTTMEIETRYRALEYKLKLIQEGVEVIVDLTNSQRNIILELMIVVLIVIELALAFWK